ncbi:MAG: Molybdopterin converting factor, small subunit [Chloroflexi bacterium]|jgi:molybdopterin converting factor small subunit|nr:MAG: Molybdopterin converting factor, small subunit [Chloroflexota bacterium]
MTVEVRVPSILQKFTEGQKTLSYADPHAGGATVGGLLATIDAKYPGFRDQLIEDGEMRRFVNIFRNDEDIRFLERMDTALEDGDVIAILPALAGGATVA